MKRSGLLLLWLGLFSTIASAQDACSRIVLTALRHVEENCQDVSRNHVCYGNVLVQAEPMSGLIPLDFNAIGDEVALNNVSSIRAAQLNLEEEKWGIGLLRIQANLPDSLPGQNVSILIFGDVSMVQNSDIANQTPMQAFTLQTGIGQRACEEVPESGLLVQSPTGDYIVNININGVDIRLGSTIEFQATPGKNLIVKALEGSAVLRFEDRLYPVVAGTWVEVTYQDGVPMPPSLPQPLILEQGLPLSLLERNIEIKAGITPQQLQGLANALANGFAPCGDRADLFPDCTRLPYFSETGHSQGATTWASPSDWTPSNNPEIAAAVNVIYGDVENYGASIANSGTTNAAITQSESPSTELVTPSIEHVTQFISNADQPVLAAPQLECERRNGNGNGNAYGHCKDKDKDKNDDDDDDD